MPALASTLIAAARTQSLDGGTRFPDADWIRWLNDAQRATVELYTTACIKTSSVQLAAGSKQSVPADGLQFVEVTRNMGTNGTTPGDVPRLANRRQLDAVLPGWHKKTAAKSIQHFLFDQDAPKVYYVYPPSDGTSYVELVYGAYPTTVTVAGDAIGLDDIFINALVSYMLFKAFDVDSEVPGNAERALIHKKAHADSVAAIAASNGRSAQSAVARG